MIVSMRPRGGSAEGGETTCARESGIQPKRTTRATAPAVLRTAAAGKAETKSVSRVSLLHQDVERFPCCVLLRFLLVFPRPGSAPVAVDDDVHGECAIVVRSF